MKQIAPRTRVQVKGWNLAMRETWEGATVLPPIRATKEYRKGDPLWHLVKFDGGGVLHVHASRLREEATR
jgi:hypothetical protein